MRFSLVVATLDRPHELNAFFTGLEAQPARNFEVIVVDQSRSDIFDDVIARYSTIFPVQHLRLDVRKARFACSVGARHATGEIIAFPDDDCIFEPDTLARVDRHFAQDDGLGFLTGAVLNLDGRPTAMGRWLKYTQVLSPKTVWCGLIEFNFFIRRPLYEAVGGLDVALGPGCRFGSAEGPDLALRLMRAGERGLFDRELLVRHKDKSATINRARARSYALGMGYVMRKNASPTSLVATMMVRPLGGVLVNLLRRRPKHAAYYFGTLIGRVEGFFSPAAARAARALPITPIGRA